MGARACHKRWVAKTGDRLGDGWLLGLALLSCLLGGWLLGYGVSPFVRNWQISAKPMWSFDAASTPEPTSLRESLSWRQDRKP